MLQGYVITLISEAKLGSFGAVKNYICPKRAKTAWSGK
jgi:hypothetical protein